MFRQDLFLFLCAIWNFGKGQTPAALTGHPSQQQKFYDILIIFCAGEKHKRPKSFCATAEMYTQMTVILLSWTAYPRTCSSGYAIIRSNPFLMESALNNVQIPSVNGKRIKDKVPNYPGKRFDLQNNSLISGCVPTLSHDLFNSADNFNDLVGSITHFLPSFHPTTVQSSSRRHILHHTFIYIFHLPCCTAIAFPFSSPIYDFVIR